MTRHSPTPAIVLGFVLSFACGLLPLGAAADIFAWTDDSGVTHYSTTRPAGQQSQAFPIDPAFKGTAPVPGQSAAARRATSAADPADAQALRNRVETLEVLLDQERGARVSDLRSQLETERDRVRRLEAERAQWSEIGGLWNGPQVYPAGAILNPAPVLIAPGHGRPLKARPAKRQADRNPLPYPSLSGPSANFR